MFIPRSSGLSLNSKLPGKVFCGNQGSLLRILYIESETGLLCSSVLKVLKRLCVKC